TRWPRDWSSDVCSSDLRQCEEFLLKRQHLRDQLLARERRATGVRIAPEAMPQTEQAFLQGQGLAAKARGRRRLRELLRAEEISQIGRASCRERVEVWMS